MADGSEDSPLVYSFEDTPSPTGGSAVGQYLHSYLSAIRARAFIKEENYIDKDYLIDYAKFYLCGVEGAEREDPLRKLGDGSGAPSPCDPRVL